MDNKIEKLDENNTNNKIDNNNKNNIDNKTESNNNKNDINDKEQKKRISQQYEEDQEILNQGIELPKDGPSNLIKILKKDKHGDVLSNISYNYLFKVALIGDSSTGKTSILLRFIDNCFIEDTKSTIGVDFKIVSLELEPKVYAKMQIWDTCGSERFKSLTSSFIKTCSAFILVFDLTRPGSFQSIENWIKTIRENISPKFMILIGNKSDLIEQRAVNKNFILEYCQKRFFNYMEISAKTNNNIERMFKEVAYQLYMNIKKNEKDKNIKSVNAGGSFTNIKMNLNNENNQNKKGCCN